ncbi:MAG: DUF1841 family protein [Pseudomonadota bacterium]
MYSNDRRKIRQQFISVWEKANKGTALEPLELIIADVIKDHPEYHPLLNNADAAIDSEFYPEHGRTNPFLHMGMHITLREQVATDRPAGIRELTRSMLLKYRDSHEMEHQMMEPLGQVLWESQRGNTLPDEKAYLEALKALATKT